MVFHCITNRLEFRIKNIANKLGLTIKGSRLVLKNFIGTVVITKNGHIFFFLKSYIPENLKDYLINFENNILSLGLIKYNKQFKRSVNLTNIHLEFKFKETSLLKDNIFKVEKIIQNYYLHKLKYYKETGTEEYLQGRIYQFNLYNDIDINLHFSISCKGYIGCIVAKTNNLQESLDIFKKVCDFVSENILK